MEWIPFLRLVRVRVDAILSYNLYVRGLFAKIEFQMSSCTPLYDISQLLEMHDIVENVGDTHRMKEKGIPCADGGGTLR